MAILRLLVFTLAASVGAASTGMSKDPLEPKVYISDGSDDTFPSCAELLKNEEPYERNYFYNFCVELNKLQAGESSDKDEADQDEIENTMDHMEGKTTTEPSKWRPSVFCPDILAREEPKESNFLKKLWKFCTEWTKLKSTRIMSDKTLDRLKPSM